MAELETARQVGVFLNGRREQIAQCWVEAPLFRQIGCRPASDSSPIPLDKRGLPEPQGGDGEQIVAHDRRLHLSEL